MNSYPYITIDQRKPVLIYKDRRGIYMVDENDTLSDLDITYVKNQKNQTAKVLANTYGEVKSKEHAEFIVELGEGAGYELVGSVSPNRAGVFVFDGENKTLFFMLGGGSLRGGSVLKQITIPLPPECESVDEWPKVGSVVTWGTKAVNGEIKGIDGELAWIRNDHGNYVTAYISELEKPKTPE